MIPKWGEYLSDLTLEFSRALEKSPGRRGTLAICLPRIEFAWCFVAFGFARSLAPAAPVTDHTERLRPFIDYEVSFVRAGEEIKGRLVEVPESSDGEFVKVAVSKTPRSELLYLLTAEEWPSIRIESESTVDDVADFRFRAAPAPEIPNELLALGRRLLGDAANDWLIGPSGTRIAAYGMRGRMVSECNSHFGLPQPMARFRLSDVIKPSGKGFVGSVGRVRLLASSSLYRAAETAALYPCCIVEPLARAEQLLQATVSANRILLLARNTAAYADSASAIVEAYRHRSHGELVCGSIAKVPSIFHQSFFHS